MDTVDFSTLPTDPMVWGPVAAGVAVVCGLLVWVILRRRTPSTAPEDTASEVVADPSNASAADVTYPGQTPGQDTAAAQDAPAWDAADELIDDVTSHLTGGPATNPDLVANPVTGQVHLRNRRTSTGDADAAPVSRAGATVEDWSAMPPQHAVHGDPGSSKEIFVPDLPAGSNTVGHVPDAPASETADMLIRLHDAIAAGDASTCAGIAAGHQPLSYAAHVAAAALSTPGPVAAAELDAALDATDRTHLEVLADLHLTVPLPLHHADVHAPAADPTTVRLALAALRPEDPDSFDAVETVHADTPSPLTHLMRLDATLTGRWLPMVPTTRTGLAHTDADQHVDVPTDTYEALALDGSAVLGSRARVDAFGVLYAHARAMTATPGALDQLHTALNAYEPGETDRVEIHLNSLHADHAYLRGLAALADDDTPMAARFAEVGLDLDPEHPGLLWLVERT